MPFDKPPPPGGGIPLAEHKGALMLIDPEKVEEGVETVNGVSDAVRCTRVAVIDGEGAPETYDDVLIFPYRLREQLRKSIGGQMLGRLGQLPPKPGKNPAWVFEPYSDADAKLAEEWIKANTAPAFSAPDDPPF